MKKTLITAAVALGFVGAAFAETTTIYTAGDVTYTTTNPIHDNHNSDKYSNMTSFTFTLTAGLFDNEATTTQTVASNGAENYADTANSKVALTSITLYESGNQNTATVPGTLTITGSDGVSITSTGFTRINDQSNGCLHDGGTWTFSFDANNLLTVGTTYTVTFAQWNMAATDLGDTSFASMKGNNTWQPSGMVLVTTSVNAEDAVPEPATATLSLLALAGLAARRRRK